MRQLKKRGRADAHVNDRRKEGKSYGRWVYLGFLALLGLGILDYVLGDYVVFRADGLVVQERIDVEAQYVGRLETVPLRIGQQVKEGEVVAVITSVEIAERLAELALRIAELIQRDLEKREEIQIAENMMPIADERVVNARTLRTNLTKLQEKGLASADRLLDVMTESNSAEELVIRLKAQLASDIRAKNALKPALAHAGEAFSTLERLYGEGVIRAPASGVVDSALPARGEVFLTGERILSLHTGRKFVLTYLPPRHLFPSEVGDKVNLSSGQLTVEGVVEEVLPVSDALPKEFQNTFKPAQRSQLARIAIPQTSGFPLHAKVNVTRKNETWSRVAALAGDIAEHITSAWRSLDGTELSVTSNAKARVEDVFRTIETAGRETL